MKKPIIITAAVLAGLPTVGSIHNYVTNMGTDYKVSPHKIERLRSLDHFVEIEDGVFCLTGDLTECLDVRRDK